MQVTRPPEMTQAQAKANGKLRHEFFAGDDDRELKLKMDNRAKDLGETVVRRRKIGRNETCPCGSGKKFKKCHLNKVRR